MFFLVISASAKSVCGANRGIAEKTKLFVKYAKYRIC